MHPGASADNIYRSVGGCSGEHPYNRYAAGAGSVVLEGEQPLDVRAVDAEVAEGQVGGGTALRRAVDEAFHNQVGLVDLFDGAGVLAEGGGDGLDAHGAALELVDDYAEQLVVDFVESVAVDIEGFEGHAGYILVDGAGAFDLGEVAHAAQQGVGDTGRAAAAAGYLVGGAVADGGVEQARRAAQNALQDFVAVVFEVAGDAETCAQGCRQQARAGGGADEGERVEGELHRPGAGALVYHDVDAVVLHRRVQVFLHHGAEAVYLVNEEHIVGLERGQDAGQVAGLVEDGSGGNLEAHAQLVGDDA